MRNKAVAHKWEFKPCFRRHTFGWKSQPAITGTGGRFVTKVLGRELGL